MAEGDFSLNQPAFAEALADVRLTITPSGGGAAQQVRFARVSPVNVGPSPISPAPVQWHLSTVQPLPAGTYDIKVEIRNGIINGTGTISANVVAGQLSVVLLVKQ